MKKHYSAPELDFFKIKSDEILTDSSPFNLDDEDILDEGVFIE